MTNLTNIRARALLRAKSFVGHVSHLKTIANMANMIAAPAS